MTNLTTAKIDSDRSPISPKKRRPWQIHHYQGSTNFQMDLSRVELLSRSDIHSPLIHRLSPSHPQGGNHPLAKLLFPLPQSLPTLNDLTKRCRKKSAFFLQSIKKEKLNLPKL